MGRVLRWSPVIFLVLLVGIGYPIVQWILQPKVDPARNPPLQLIDVPEGLPFQQVAAQLEEKGVIESRGVFVLLAQITNTDRQVKPGEYVFHAGMEPLTILDDLREGKTLLHQVTFPEGFTVRQVAARLARHGLVEEDAFVALTENTSFIQSLGLQVASLEGYLFPTTYQFEKYSSPKDIIRTMVTFWKKAFSSQLREQAKRLNMSVHEVLTLASLVEKETGAAEERRMISGVFHNRLSRDIMLQSDPTVIYALENFDGNIRKKDLSIDHPYNTYRYKGLPPGPIANPGLASIEAALSPDKSSYLYFVSRNDGTHYFSSSLKEHNRAVDKFQRRGRKVS